MEGLEDYSRTPAVGYGTGASGSIIEQKMYNGIVDSDQVQRDAITDAAFAAGGTILAGGSTIAKGASTTYAQYARSEISKGVTISTTNSSIWAKSFK